MVFGPHQRREKKKELSECAGVVLGDVGFGVCKREWEFREQNLIKGRGGLS